MAKVSIQQKDPLGKNIWGVPTPTITDVNSVTPKTQTPNMSVAPVVAPVVAPATKAPSPIASAVKAAKAKTVPAPTAPVETTQWPQTGNTINMTAEQYAAWVAKVGKEKMDASMQKFLNQWGTLTWQQASIIGDQVSSINEMTAPQTTPTPTTPTETKTETPTTPTTPTTTTTPTPVQPKTTDEAFSILMSGGKLDNTKENALFQNDYNTFSSFNAMDEKTLGNVMAKWDLTPKMANLLARYNPAKLAAAQKIANDTTSVNDINTNAQNLYSLATGTPKPTVTKTSDQLMQDLIDGIDKVDQKYSDIVAKAYADNPQIKEKADKLAVLDDKIDTIDAEIEKMYETYRTKYPDVPQGMLIGMVNRATYGLTQERNALVKESKLLYSQYKDEKDMIDKGIEYDIAQQEKVNQRLFDLRTTLYWDKRADEIREEDYARAEERIMNDRTYTEEQRKIALKDNLKIALGDMWVKINPDADYNTLLSQYADAKKEEIQRWFNLDRYQAETQRINALKTKTTDDWYTLWDYSDIWEVADLYEWPMSDLIGANPWDVIPTTREEYRKLTPTWGMQCAEYVNRIMGSSFWNSLDSKLKIASDDTGTVGSAVVMDVWTPEWHIWIITKDLWDAWEVKSSNFNNDGRISVDVIPKDKVAWYYTPDALKNKTLSPNQRVISNQIITNFQTRQKDFETALNQYRNLAVSLQWDPTWVKDLGSVYTFMKTLDPSSVVRETEFATAAAASGIMDRNTMLQYWQKFKDWVILTGKQRENMLNISKEFVKQRAERYNTEYEEALKALWQNWISKKQIFFPKSTNFLEEHKSQEMDEADLLETQQSIFEAKAKWKTNDEIYNELKALWVDPLLFDY